MCSIISGIFVVLGAASCDWPTLTLAPGEGLVGSRGQNVHRMSPLDPEVAEAVEAWGQDDVAWKGAWQQPQQGQQGMQGKRLTGRMFQNFQTGSTIVSTIDFVIDLIILIYHPNR